MLRSVFDWTANLLLWIVGPQPRPIEWKSGPALSFPCSPKALVDTVSPSEKEWPYASLRISEWLGRMGIAGRPSNSDSVNCPFFGHETYFDRWRSYASQSLNQLMITSLFGLSSVTFNCAFRTWNLDLWRTRFNPGIGWCFPYGYPH
jgi:hypothetical protein